MASTEHESEIAKVAELIKGIKFAMLADYGGRGRIAAEPPDDNAASRIRRQPVVLYLHDNGKSGRNQS